MADAGIRELSARLAVPFLLHFTRALHLPSIVQHGLYPVARIGEINAAPQINDPYRLDGHLGALSLSIGFPNYRMFYRLRNDNPGVDWVVLAIDPVVLWTKDCAFCRHNAADNRISRQPIEMLKTVQAFAGMYEEIDGETPRAEQQLRTYDPTDGQAEILVFDVIEPTLIRGIAFGSAAAKVQHQASIEDRQVVVHGNNQGYFASRSYVRVRR